MKLIWECKNFDSLDKAELYGLIALRIEVFVLEQNCVFQDLDYRDQKAWHLMGKNKEGKIVAYSRLFDLSQEYKNHVSIGRVATHPKARKKGLGKELLNMSISKCNELFGVHPIKIGAQKYLVDFYTRFGFEEIGNDYLEDGIPHTAMVKKSFA